MSEVIRTVIAAFLILLGAVTILISIFGIFKFRFVMNRMHSAALLDAMGLGLILVALMVLSGSISYIPKLVLILAIQWIGSPIASHMVGRLEVHTNDEISEHMDIENHYYPEAEADADAGEEEEET